MSDERVDTKEDFKQLIERLDERIKGKTLSYHQLVYNDTKILALILRMEILQNQISMNSEIVKINNHMKTIFTILKEIKDEMGSIQETEKIDEIVEVLRDELTELAEIRSDLVAIHAQEAENLEKMR